MAVNATACVPPTRPGPERQARVWVTYLGTPRHDAAANESLNPDPRPLWQADVGRAVRGSPALGESVLVAGTVDRNVVLIDRGTGEPYWRTRLDGTVHGGPLLDDDRIYVASEALPDGRVYSLRLRDGKILWRRDTGGVVAPLAFDGAALYAANEAGVVYRIDPDNGDVKWKRALGGDVRAAPVPTPDGLVVATTDDTLYLLDPLHGTVTGRLPTPGSVLAAPAYADHRIFLGTTRGRVLAIGLPGLAVQWDRDAGDAVLGAPALDGDTLYVLTRAGTLWLIPVAAPDSATSHALGIVARAGPTPIVSGVLAASVSGEVLLVDRAGGTVLWRAQLDGPIEEPPLVRDRTLLVVAGRGDIHAYR